MNPTKMAEKQRFLARTASEHPEHRFTNLYDLLHWDYWMHISAERVLARPGRARPTAWTAKRGLRSRRTTRAR